MGNILENISKDNTRFTIFENNQVLTADQLNDLFNYLDIQSRLTRTRAIGVGIICGLEIGLLENKHIVVSKGTAITTDGDLLHLDIDQEFDQYQAFEDVNAKYPYFRLENEELIAVYALSSSIAGGASGSNLGTLEQTTNTVLQDYVGILYLEDYINDPGVCTGTDCDNKGAEASKEIKVLLVHKNSIGLLLESIPPLNKNYFALDDIAMPRPVIQNTISQYSELNTAFTNALSVKTEIKDKLAKAYQVCKPVVDDEFGGTDPTSEWNQLLDSAFNTGTSVYTQYVYDFARDLTYAYNEMRENLFADNMLCCPDVSLFPKHVLLGTIKTASADSASVLTSPPLSTTNVGFSTLNSLIRIRFDVTSLIRRFHPMFIDTQYRHAFYESPVLNNKEENIEKIKFCFMRLHSMIHNFKIPTAEVLQNPSQSIKITPGFFEDKPLGTRSLPFYYNINSNIQANLYWSYEANIHQKENEILSYSSNLYATKPSVLSPLLFNLFPFDFFRIEGYLGFKYQDVESVLNNLISSNNLPINLITVQIENTIETIPDRSWFFPHLYLYEKAQQKTFLNLLNETDIVNDELKTQDSSVQNSEFKIAKQTVLDNTKDVSDKAFNFSLFSTSVSNVITAASNVKAQTKQYTFSNAATPHDLVNNTPILQKTDVISNIFQQNIIKKKQGLMLGNFLKQNPGLEHAGGVLRGGTFVLIYTSADQKVVADFMLPYASVDKDIVVDPPVYTGPIFEPPVLKFPLNTIFEKVPTYIGAIDTKLSPYAKVADVEPLINTKVDAKIIDVNTILNATLTAKFDSQKEIIDTKLASTDTIINKVGQTNSELFDKILTTKFNANVVSNDKGNFTVAGKDYTSQLLDLQTKQKEVQDLPPTADPAEKEAKEAALILAAKNLADELNKPAVAADTGSAIVAKSVLADINSATSVVTTETLKSQAADIAKTVNNANLNIRFNP